VERLKKRLEDEAASNEVDAVEAIKALGEVEMTKDLLRRTGVGKTLRKFSKDSREQVAAVAKSLLERWKALAKKERDENPFLSQRTTSVMSSISSTSSVPEKKTKEAENGKDKSKKEELKRKRKEDTSTANGSSLKKAKAEPSNVKALQMPSEQNRKKTCELLKGFFRSEEVKSKFEDKEVENIAIKVEKAMTDAFGANSAEYKAKYRTLKANMKLNPTLQVRLLEGMLSPDKLVKMSDQQLLSKEKAEQIEKAKQEILSAAEVDWLDKNREEMMKAAGVNIEEGMFVCGRCGSTKTTHYQKQTRSADEPMTVFVQCTNCPNRWRC